MEISLVQGATSLEWVDRLLAVGQSAFDSMSRDYLQWRLANQPDVTLFVALDDDRLAGFKAGYAMTERRYYSWLGAVDPQYRRQGIAAQLMTAQHRWIAASRYAVVETHVRAANEAMVSLNLRSGLVVTGNFVKDGIVSCIMQRQLERGADV